MAGRWVEEYFKLGNMKDRPLRTSGGKKVYPRWMLRNMRLHRLGELGDSYYLLAQFLLVKNTHPAIELSEPGEEMGILEKRRFARLKRVLGMRMRGDRDAGDFPDKGEKKREKERERERILKNAKSVRGRGRVCREG